MFVELVDSHKTQVPYDYYKLPFCRKPESQSQQSSSQKKKKRSNLGQRLTGHSIQPLSYELSAAQNTGCTPLCRISIPAVPDLQFLRRLVKDQYRVHFTLDDLPVLMRKEGFSYAVRGYPLGFVARGGGGGGDVGGEGEGSEGNSNNGNNGGGGKEVLYLYNHLRFTIYYNELLPDTTTTTTNTKPQGGLGNLLRITGFHVFPVSIAHAEPDGGWGKQQQPPQSQSQGGEQQRSGKTLPELSTCNRDSGSALNQPETWLPLNTGAAGEDFSVVYSYEVEWKKSDVKWADRWDIYLMETPDNEVHYFSIINSLMIALLLTGAVAIIMIRALRKDIAQYNDLEESIHSVSGGNVSSVEESGWKLVHGDVFRRPRVGRTILSVLVGTGMQIGTSVVLTLGCLMFRVLLDPMKKGQTLTGIIMLYVLSGSVAGYTSARMYRYFDGTYWKRTAVLTAVAFPGVSVSMFLSLNFVLSFHDAASAVSPTTILMIFALWVCVSTPLTFVGSFLGHRAVKICVPTKSNQIARFVPASESWLVKSPHSMLLGGILPFFSVCIELYFVMGALWLHQVYYIMGFAFGIFFILTLSISTISMVLTYLSLCGEEYRWWWRSFWSGASAGLYLFLYSIWFLATKLELVVGVAPLMVYLTYMGIICWAFGLYCGGVGVLSSFWFCRKIYAAVKVD